MDIIKNICTNYIVILLLFSHFIYPLSRIKFILFSCLVSTFANTYVVIMAAS